MTWLAENWFNLLGVAWSAYIVGACIWVFATHEHRKTKYVFGGRKVTLYGWVKKSR